MNSPNAQEIFDRAAMRRNRARAEERFAQHSILYDETCAALLDRLSFITRPFLNILIIGSRTPALARCLREQNPQRLVVEAATHHAGLGPSCVIDEEWLPFQENSFDLILSLLTLHMVNDVPGALVQMRSALKPDGLLLAAFFGGETLYELRRALYETEIQQWGGLSPRVFPFTQLHDAAALLQRAGFIMPVADKERFTLTYENAFSLMHELRRMGEGNMLHARNKRLLPRTFFHAVASNYGRHCGDADGRIPATFDVLYLSGWTAPQQA